MFKVDASDVCMHGSLFSLEDGSSTSLQNDFKTFTRLHTATSKNTVLFILVTMKTPNLTQNR
jgi:hypothetical protein